MAKLKCPCNNCGGKNYALYFPHPRRKAKIKKSKEDRADCRGGGGCGSGQSGGHKSNRNKWSKRNYNKDGNRKYYVNGVQKRGNDWI